MPRYERKLNMPNIKDYYDKSGNKRYMFRMYLGVNPQTGKKQQTTRRGFKTKKEASLEASKLELEVASGCLKKDNNILFKSVYENWYQGYTNTVRESTMARTDAMFQNHILPEFGNKRIRTITIDQCQRAVNKWFKIAPHNFKKWFNYTSNVFDYAIKEEIIDKNPTKLVNVPKKQVDYGDKPANFWNKDELKQFFSYINPNEELEKYTLFRILAFAGLRRGECLALTWDDINFSKSTIRINKTLTQGIGGKQIIQAPKTRKGRRTIKLDHKTMSYIKKWRIQQRKYYLMLGFNTINKHPNPRNAIDKHNFLKIPSYKHISPKNAITAKLLLTPLR